MGPLQCKQATLRRLRNVLARAQSELSAAQRRYNRGFDRKLSSRPVVNVEDFAYVNRPPRALSRTEMLDPKHLDGSTTDASQKLLPKSESL